MSRITDIAHSFPTTLKIGGTKFHESLTRSHAVLRYVTELLEAGTPAPVILEIIKTIDETGMIEAGEWECADSKWVEFEKRMLAEARARELANCNDEALPEPIPDQP